MSFRAWVSIITLILLGLVVYFGWPEIVQAWGLLDSVNIWILSLLIPAQLFSYYANGGMIFSYLRSKGNLKDTTHWQMARMTLELNFVNHILPSGGAVGFSYLGWVLGRHGVSAGRAIMAQIVRFVATFVTFITMLAFAITVLIFDNNINKTVVIICAIMIIGVIAVIAVIIYMVGNHKRLVKFSGWLTRTVNNFVSRITRGKKTGILNLQEIEKFFTEIHQDYLEILVEKKILIKPLLWAIIENAFNVILILIAFLALGHWVSPATLFVAFGISSIAGVISSVPGGAGVYEAVMIAFLASSGVPADIAIAGTLLARVILLGGTIIFGYFFYQLTINKYGKVAKPANI
jgi:uncharacterized protein (TIRG00374 family)